MVTVPSLVDETPLDQYTANAGQTDFNFTYMIFATADIKVYVNGTLKTETTDYVVKQSDGSSIVPADDLPMDGGKIVFNSGLTLNDEVSLSRDIAIERLSGFSTAGAYRADVVNAEITKLFSIQQQLERDLARTVRLSAYDAEGGSLVLPENRASKFLAFNAEGDFIASSGTVGDSPIPISSFMETVLDDTTAAAARTTLGAQAQDDNLDTLAALSSIDNLTALAGLTGAADKIPYFTGAGAMGISHLPSNRNLAINGQGLIAQEGTSFTSATTPANNDDTYLFDQMILLSDGNDIVDVSQETTEIPQGAYSSIKFDVETANKQFAYFQPLEARDAAKIIGGVASLSFKMKKGGSNATLETFRAAIISWSSTADTITSDVIGTWAGAGANPTLASNWTYENTPSDLTLTTSFQTFKIENISIDTASTTNVGILIWCDDTDATVGDVAYLGDIQLEEGAIATPYEQKSYQEEWLRCSPYMQVLDYASGGVPFAIGQVAGSATVVLCEFQYPLPVRSTPSISVTGTWEAWNASAGSSATGSIVAEDISTNACHMRFTRSGGVTLTDGDASGINAVGAATIKIKSQL